jgi:hypothetical protein
MSRAASFAATTLVGAAGVVYTVFELAEYADDPAVFVARTRATVLRFTAFDTTTDDAALIDNTCVNVPPLTDVWIWFVTGCPLDADVSTHDRDAALSDV